MKGAIQNVSLTLGAEVPADYGKSPIFAATRHPEGRERIETSSQREYYIGGIDSRTGLCFPAFDVRHGRAILAILCFRPSNSQDRFVRFSLNKICQTYASHNGGRYSREILAILKELTQIPVRVYEKPLKNWFEYRILDSLTITEKPIRRSDDSRITDRQSEFWLDGCTISSEFLNVLNTDELLYLRLDQLKKIRSPLGQAIYFYVPSRAYHASKARPWSISLRLLCKQVGYDVPDQLSRRRLLFEGDNRGPSLLEQLDGLETAFGIFRVCLRFNHKANDFMLDSWSEPRPLPPQAISEDIGKLGLAYLNGHTEAELQNRLKKKTPLDGYQLHLLHEYGINLSTTLNFFEQANCLLGTIEFNALLSTLKTYLKEPGRLVNGEKVRNPTGFFIDMCIRATQEKASQHVPSKVSIISIDAPDRTVPVTTRETTLVSDTQSRHRLDVETPSDEQKKIIAENFWKNMNPNRRTELEEEVLKNANEFDLEIISRGTAFSQQHRESILYHWALEQLGIKV